MSIENPHSEDEAFQETFEMKAKIQSGKANSYEEAERLVDRDKIEEKTETENELEHIPTPEEVSSVFRELIGKEHIEGRKLEDEQGLYLYDVKIPGDSADEEIEYGYMRKGHYKEGASTATEIHITYYKNGVPISGTSAARYVDGKWIIL